MTTHLIREMIKLFTVRPTDKNEMRKINSLKCNGIANINCHDLDYNSIKCIFIKDFKMYVQK